MRYKRSYLYIFKVLKGIQSSIVFLHLRFQPLGRNFKLLSFGLEAEEDDEETEVKPEDRKMKSSHDVLDDPRLSSLPAVDKSNKRRLSDDDNVRFSLLYMQMLIHFRFVPLIKFHPE